MNLRFYRLSNEKYTNGWYTPVKRQLWGSDEFNKFLIKLGLLDRENCIHFMDKISLETNLRSNKELYGNNLYEVYISDDSNLSWSFCYPINDWYYPRYKKGEYKLSTDLNKFMEKLSKRDKTYSGEFIKRQEYLTNKKYEYLLKLKITGSGSLNDLKKTKFFGKYPVFIWTNDDVRIHYLEQI